MRSVSRIVACAALTAIAGCANTSDQTSINIFGTAAGDIAAKRSLVPTSITVTALPPVVSDTETALLLDAFAPSAHPVLRMQPPLARPTRN